MEQQMQLQLLPDCDLTFHEMLSRVKNAGAQPMNRDIHSLITPAVLLDLDAMEHNLKKYQEMADQYHKQIWPMTKTHKSSQLMRLQKKYGASGFLCGTLDECEAAAREGLSPVMYAYPPASLSAILRLIRISQTTDLYIRLDDIVGAGLVEREAAAAGVQIKYTVIIDCGLHRFGISPSDIVEFVQRMEVFPHLVFEGLSSHPGQVYASESPDDVPGYAEEERTALHIAVTKLEKAGIKPHMVTSGSTPTFSFNIDDDVIQIYHPGNYIFNDTLQISTRTATEKECALTVLATVISHPAEDRLIIDAGAKCLGLDQGAHGNHSVKGYGRVPGHPELIIEGLSEEVGKVHINGKTNVKTGDQIRIIPNHSCSSANLTSYYYGIRFNQVDQAIRVDLRDNSTNKAEY